MTITSADWARMYGDPDEDYDSMEKCIVRAIDSLDALTIYIDDYITDGELGQMDLKQSDLKYLKSLRAVCFSLRDDLCKWSSNACGWYVGKNQKKT